MIRDQPNAADLLHEARRELADGVLPDINSKARYKVAMVLRAMELAERELNSDPAVENRLVEWLRQLLATDEAEPLLIDMLKRRLREGKFDASEKLYEMLRLAVANRLKVSNPMKVPGDLESRLNGL